MSHNVLFEPTHVGLCDREDAGDGGSRLCGGGGPHWDCLTHSEALVCYLKILYLTS